MTDCTDAELRRFIEDRGLEATWTTRKVAIRALRRADRDAVFRFLDLSPELRNFVYEDLLVLRSKGAKSDRQWCYPGILRASKQAHVEGMSILYSSETGISINLGLSTQYDVRQFTISCNNRLIGRGREWRLTEGTVKWPPYLLKMRHLKVNISLGSYTPGGFWKIQYHVQVNNALYDLSQYLTSHTNSPNVSIVVADGHGHYGARPGGDDRTLRVLFPLTIFPPNTTIKTDNMPDTLATSITNMTVAQAQGTPREDLLHKLYTLDQRTKDEIEKHLQASVVDLERLYQLRRLSKTLSLQLTRGLDGMISARAHQNLADAVREAGVAVEKYSAGVRKRASRREDRFVEYVALRVMERNHEGQQQRPRIARH